MQRNRRGCPSQTARATCSYVHITSESASKPECKKDESAKLRSEGAAAATHQCGKRGRARLISDWTARSPIRKCKTLTSVSRQRHDTDTMDHSARLRITLGMYAFVPQLVELGWYGECDVRLSLLFPVVFCFPVSHFFAVQFSICRMRHEHFPRLCVAAVPSIYLRNGEGKFRLISQKEFRSFHQFPWSKSP